MNQSLSRCGGGATLIASSMVVRPAATFIAAPWLFGVLIGSGERLNVFYGYLLGAVLMYIAVGFELRYGVRAERVSLEKIAAPLSSQPE